MARRGVPADHDGDAHRDRDDRRGVRAGPRQRPPRGADALPDGRLPGSGDLARDRRWPTPRAAPTWSSWACRSPTRWPTGRSIHAAGTRGAARRRHARRRCSRWRATSPPRVPVVLMCYANPILARGLERFLDALVAAGVSGLIVPDLPLEEATEVRAGLPPARAWPSCRSSRRPRRPSGWSGSAPGASGFLYTVSVTGTTGERSEMAGGLATVIARAAAHTDVPVALGFGISTPGAGVGRGRRRRRRRHRRQPARARRRRGRRPRGRGPRAGRRLLGSAVCDPARLASAIPWA